MKVTSRLHEDGLTTVIDYHAETTEDRTANTALYGRYDGTGLIGSASGDGSYLQLIVLPLTPEEIRNNAEADEMIVGLNLMGARVLAQSRPLLAEAPATDVEVIGPLTILGFPRCGLESAVEKGTGKYLHVREGTGNPAYTARFDDVAGFSDQVAESRTPLAAVQLNSEGFHIRPDGTAAYPERYALVMDFEGGRAQVVRKDDRRCFITFYDDGVVSEFGEW